MIIKITDFKRAHREEAERLGLKAYEEERLHVPGLAPIAALPDLEPFADNGLGAAAFQEGKMVGFMCGCPPFDNAFGSTDIRGIFSPMGANAVAKENSAKIYAALYQAAGEKWVRAGAVSHAVCLYAHDTVSWQQFFRYGFGLRCVDGIRLMEPLDCTLCEGYEFFELSCDEYTLAYPLNRMLNQHQCSSPYFMNREPHTARSYAEECVRENSRLFAARYSDEICAYVKITQTGETFITGQPDYCHISGAYCLQEHRGKGVYQNLLNIAIKALRQEGYIRLGVDFESFNPTAYGFWLKYFDAYTYGVVRRIDERILRAGL